MAQLQINTGNDVRVSDLSASVTIGRHPDNTIILDVDSISTHHAHIKVTDDKFMLRDLNSTNGTKVNGNSITKIELHNDDILQFADVEARFTCKSKGSEANHSTSKNICANTISSSNMKAVPGLTFKDSDEVRLVIANRRNFSKNDQFYWYWEICVLNQMKFLGIELTSKRVRASLFCNEDFKTLCNARKNLFMAFPQLAGSATFIDCSASSLSAADFCKHDRIEPGEILFNGWPDWYQQWENARRERASYARSAGKYLPGPLLCYLERGEEMDRQVKLHTKRDAPTINYQTMAAAQRSYSLLQRNEMINELKDIRDSLDSL